MTDLEKAKYDLEVLLNSYSKESELYSESEITWIRFGLTKALKIIDRYIKEKK